MEIIQTETILLASASIAIPLILAGVLQLLGKTRTAKKALITSVAFAIVCGGFFFLDVVLGMEKAKALFSGTILAVIVGAILGRILRKMG
jgi:hypothetical protein